jgi:hypothetical protein
VEVSFADSENREWVIVDDASVFDVQGRLSPDSAYPVEVLVLCDAQWIGAGVDPKGTVQISFESWGLRAQGGKVEFEVYEDQLSWGRQASPSTY